MLPLCRRLFNNKSQSDMTNNLLKLFVYTGTVGHFTFIYSRTLKNVLRSICVESIEHKWVAIYRFELSNFVFMIRLWVWKRSIDWSPIDSNKIPHISNTSIYRPTVEYPITHKTIIFPQIPQSSLYLIRPPEHTFQLSNNWDPPPEPISQHNRHVRWLIMGIWR